MRKYDFGENRYYESTDFSSEGFSTVDLERFVNCSIRLFTKRRLFGTIVRLYGNKHDLRGNTLLHAHGIKNRKKFLFVDGKRKYVMQNWIDKIDGTTLTILLYCCNPRNLNVETERSIVIHPKNSIDVRDMIRGGNLRIYVPGQGYLESHYELRRTISSLRQ